MRFATMKGKRRAGGSVAAMPLFHHHTLAHARGAHKIQTITMFIRNTEKEASKNNEINMSRSAHDGTP